MGGGGGVLPVNYDGVVEKLSETSGFKEKGHVQHHVAVPWGDGTGWRNRINQCQHIHTNIVKIRVTESSTLLFIFLNTHKLPQFILK